MREAFIGREKELAELNDLYLQDRFQLFVLYGRKTAQLHIKPFTYQISSKFLEGFARHNKRA